MKVASSFTLYSSLLSIVTDRHPILSIHQESNLRRFRESTLGLPLSLDFPKKRRNDYVDIRSRFALENSEGDTTGRGEPELAVLLEVDGVLMDAYRLGNRNSFNVAFKKLGLDCSNWSEPVYLDLLRRAVGNEELMLTLYFNQIGWPSSLPTSEKDSFVENVLRQKKIALGEFAMLKTAPLRPGLEEFIDDAYNEGIPVVILTAYGKIDEKVARSIVDKIGEERLSNVKIVGKEEVEQSLYGRFVVGNSLLDGPEEEIAKEALKAVFSEKQRIAEEVASMLRVSVELDSPTSESTQMIVTALRAGAEIVGVPVDKCILVAGSQTGLSAAQRIAMPCIVLRSSLTARAEFPSARAVVDGFGGGDLTISRLKNKL